MKGSQHGTMSRNLYLLAASLLLFSLISCGMSLVPNALQPGLPANGSLWKMIGLAFLLALSLIHIWLQRWVIIVTSHGNYNGY